MYQAFACAARASTPERQWADYALKTQIVQDACVRSAALGRPVTI
jgi:hypothetical protein